MRQRVRRNFLRCCSDGGEANIFYLCSDYKDDGTNILLDANENAFGPAFPVPSVPLDSADFDPDRYWQGPTWVNTNWLVIQGLETYGFNDHADALRETTLEMVSRSGFAEYFDPNTAEPLGAHNFSWTAALVVDLLKRSK